MKKEGESKKCNVELLLNVIPQITPSPLGPLAKPTDVYHLNRRVRSLRTHDIVLIMPFLIPKIQSYISLSITMPLERGVEIRKKLVGMGNFNSKIRDVSLN